MSLCLPACFCKPLIARFVRIRLYPVQPDALPWFQDLSQAEQLVQALVKHWSMFSFFNLECEYPNLKKKAQNFGQSKDAIFYS